MTQPTGLMPMLAANPFFAGLSPAAREKIAAIGTMRRPRAGETLFFKGDTADGLYLVRRGQVAISVTDETGRRMTLNMLGSGDVFGEIALLDGQARTADAVVIEDAELFFVPRSTFLRLLAADSSLAVQVIELLCARLRDVSARMEDRGFLTLPARLARRMAVLVEDYGSEILISQEELALLAGATRETVNRQLRRWQAEGHISLGRRRITVHDTDFLTRIEELSK
ncbi:Crp/Fnr family transcriptional regulator (plasmid) [Paroceanicella profunda]|uniref:Crp/Fnr family transcriptional regulator n=1 Tax=Paroceanicella profunda TaxID=2579971 RepID=A0A5B8FJG8_9RHOB|nr:Crp/Fnr family transcriptional regulator [Paroceanicella profunda]QDL94417.1 Crp/Fnr family transcriptional regulator [Paroceanicella profunda]